MPIKMPEPSFTICPETGEVRIPYDHFMSFMAEVASSLEEAESAVRAFRFKVEMGWSNEQLRRHLLDMGKSMRGSQ